MAMFSIFRLNLPVASGTVIPNFFMPSEQLEQSMRALRFSATSNTPSQQPTNLLLREASYKKPIAAEFSQKSQILDAKVKGQVPIPMQEADRIARIFASRF